MQIGTKPAKVGHLAANPLKYLPEYKATKNGPFHKCCRALCNGKTLGLASKSSLDPGSNPRAALFFFLFFGTHFSRFVVCVVSCCACFCGATGLVAVHVMVFSSRGSLAPAFGFDSASWHVSSVSVSFSKVRGKDYLRFRAWCIGRCQLRCACSSFMERTQHHADRSVCPG